MTATVVETAFTMSLSWAFLKGRAFLPLFYAQALIYEFTVVFDWPAFIVIDVADKRFRVDILTFGDVDVVADERMIHYLLCCKSLTGIDAQHLVDKVYGLRTGLLEPIAWRHLLDFDVLQQLARFVTA